MTGWWSGMTSLSVIPDVIGDPGLHGFPVVAGNDEVRGFPVVAKTNKDSVPVVGGSFPIRAWPIKCKSRSVRRLEKQHRGRIHYAFRNTGFHTLEMNADPQKQITIN